MAPKAGTLAPPASTLPPPPTIPGDAADHDARAAALGALTDEELAALSEELVGYFTDAAPVVRSVEDYDQLTQITETVEVVATIQAERAASTQAMQDQVAELAARLQAVTDPGDGDPAAEGEPPSGDPEAVPDDPAATPPPENVPSTGDPEGAPQTTPTGTPAEVPPAVSPANPTPPADPSTGRQPAPQARAASARASLQDLATRIPAALRPRPVAPEGQVVITASADVPGFPAGRQLNSIEEIAAAMIERHHTLGAGRGGPDDNVPVARFSITRPNERMLSSQDSVSTTQARINRFATSGNALTAAGGLCAPTVGYYDQLVVAGAATPVADLLPTFGADRGGIRFNPPPRLTQITSGVGIVTAAQDAGQGSSFADAATTNGSPTLTSATAAFTFSDVGRPITGSGIPANTTILGVTNATTVTLSQNATATATGVTIVITRSFKPTFVVTCPGIVEVVVQSIFTSIQFGNFLGRSFPEQVQAWVQLAAALTARTSETALLDAIAANSTAVTSAGVTSAGREILARMGQAAMGYRSRNRMAPDAILDALLPSYAMDLAVADITRGSADPDKWAVARGMVETWLAARNLRVGWYLDSKTGGNQIVAAQAAGVLNQFPGTLLAYLFAPGSFLHLDAGTLDLGLIRDSPLIERNNVRLFSESWENVAFVGVEALEIAMTLQPTGAAPAAVTVASPIVT